MFRLTLDVLNGRPMNGILTPAQVESFAKASAAMAEAGKPTSAAAPVSPDKSAVATTVTDKVVDAGSGGVVSGVKSESDKGATPPVPPDALDLSFLPESVRSKVRVESEEALAALKSGYMAHSQATKKFIEASNLRKEAEALKRSADNYDFLMADEEMAAVVAKAIADKKAGRPLSPVDEPASEFDTLDPKAVVAEIEKRAAAKVAEEVSRLRKEMAAPDEYRKAMNVALGAYAEQHAVDPATMIEAIKLAAADLDAAGETAEPKDVPRLMGAYVRLARSAKPPTPTPTVNKPVTPNGRAGTEAVTSPVGRGGPQTASVVPVPTHWVGGKQPLRETDEQQEESHLYRMRQRFGPEVTLEDVRAGIAGR